MFQLGFPLGIRNSICNTAFYSFASRKPVCFLFLSAMDRYEISVVNLTKKEYICFELFKGWVLKSFEFYFWERRQPKFSHACENGDESNLGKNWSLCPTIQQLFLVTSRLVSFIERWLMFVSGPVTLLSLLVEIKSNA